MELELTTPLTISASASFFLDKKCIYLVAEHLYDRIKQETLQTHTPASRQH